MAKPSVLSCLFLLLVTSFNCCSSQESPAGTGVYEPLCCRGSIRAPVVLGERLRFCRETGLISCCGKVEDAILEKRFQAKNITDLAFAAIFKSYLCKRCSPAVATATSCQKPQESKPNDVLGLVLVIASLGVALAIAIAICIKIITDEGRPLVDCRNWFRDNICCIWGNLIGGDEVQLARQN